MMFGRSGRIDNSVVCEEMQCQNVVRVFGCQCWSFLRMVFVVL